MATFPLSPTERDLVSAAVTAAEEGTDGEIVVIVTQRSDDYHDTGLVAAILLMLLAVALAALNPTALDAKIATFLNGWDAAPSPAQRYLALLAIQIILAIAALLVFGIRAVRIGLTPKAVRSRRVRRRAIQYFKVGAERRTVARVGVLLYLSLDERLAEIVADQAIHAKVPPERWGEAMAALLDAVRAGHPGEGMAAAVGAIGRIVAEHFPKTESDRNELPDRLIEL